MNNPQSTALAFLMGLHNADQAAKDAAEVVVTVHRNADPKAVRAGLKGEAAAPIAIPSVPKTMGPVREVITPGTFDATAFLKAMRRAKSREEKIAAMNAYKGFVLSRDFGSQEQEMLLLAQRELKPLAPIAGPSREEIKAAARAAAGFVQGMPDMQRRRVQDLLGREQQAVDAMIQHRNEAMDPKRTMAERTLSAGLADFEQERLVNIRAELAREGVSQ